MTEFLIIAAIGVGYLGIASGLVVALLDELGEGAIPIAIFWPIAFPALVVGWLVAKAVRWALR